MPSDSSAPKSAFLAAEEIKGILGGREKAEQHRIIRWVAESLDLKIGTQETQGASPHDMSAITPPPSDADTAAASAADSISRTPDMRTFVKGKEPKSDMQFAAVVAYFFRFIALEGERKETITSADLQTAARLAQWGVFKKPTKPLNNAINQGYLDRAGRGAYRLNAVGENLVTMTLPGTGEEARKKARPSRGRKDMFARGAKPRKRSS